MQVRGLTFTNNADVEAVIQLQRRVSEAVLGGVVELDFYQMGWGPSEAEPLRDALQLCGRLESLKLQVGRQRPDSLHLRAAS